ncbi:MAG TPA: four helix bundle protein [Flavobacteriia bacterium]|nr:four helix bundle protein [Flavobacteriia bacterium]
MIKHNFRKLIIWQESLELVIETYKTTKNFPSEEKFGLSSQLNRCSVSIPSNIAEGTSKSSEKHFKNYLETSLGSAFEWETQITIAQRVGYINQDKFTELENRINKIQNMIYKFMISL